MIRAAGRQEARDRQPGEHQGLDEDGDYGQREEQHGPGQDDRHGDELAARHARCQSIRARMPTNGERRDGYPPEGDTSMCGR